MNNQGRSQERSDRFRWGDWRWYQYQLSAPWPSAWCLSKYMVCETGWPRYRFHIIWPCLCWQKGGLDLSASSVLNHRILDSQILSVGGLSNDEVAAQISEQEGRQAQAPQGSGMHTACTVFCKIAPWLTKQTRRNYTAYVSMSYLFPNVRWL